MLFLGVVCALVVLAVGLVVISDIAIADEAQIRGLHRVLWVLTSLLATLAAAITWWAGAICGVLAAVVWTWIAKRRPHSAGSDTGR